jgi:lysophospholipase L1-like esterase
VHRGELQRRRQGRRPAEDRRLDAQVPPRHRVLHGATGFTTADRLDRLVARVYADNPDAYVVLVQIIPMAGRPEQVAYDALVPKVAEKYRAQGRSVAVVDMSTLLSVPGDYRDALHPTQAGFDKMGMALYPAISTAYRSFV